MVAPLRRRRLATLAVVGCVAIGCGDDDESSATTLTYYESKGGEFNPIGAGFTGDGPAKPGDGFAIKVGLEDDEGASVGSIHAVCLVASNDDVSVCSSAADLDEGQLNVAVVAKLDQNFSGTITGGTGAYTGATGTFESVQKKGEPYEDTFTFTVPDDE